MARINTNVPAIVAQRTLRQNHRDLQISLERLSSGLRINRGADDPAGLINSEALRAEIAGVNKGISNSQRAINIIATTEGALNEVAALLVDVQGLIVENANDAALSDEEKRANQLQIDSAIESITRIANTTTFAGRKLLNGSLDYVTSGVNRTQLANVTVTGAQFGNASYLPVEVQVTTSAQKAELYWRHSAVPAGKHIAIEVEGSKGVTTFEWDAGVTIDQMIMAINAEAQATGVAAVRASATDVTSGIKFLSNAYGSDQFVSIRDLAGGDDFGPVDGAGSVKKRDEGRDAVALINGATARGRGLDLTLNTRTLDMNITLNEAFNSLNTANFAITGGGALFQLGPEVSTNQQVNLGVQSIAATKLGSANIGFLSQIMEGDQFEAMGTPSQMNRASEIISESIRQVAVLRGRLGAFERNTLQTNISSLTITMENLTSSESAIRDTDFAAETSQLTRNQILVSAGTSVLALANQTSQSVLGLLGGG